MTSKRGLLVFIISAVVLMYLLTLLILWQLGEPLCSATASIALAISTIIAVVVSVVAWLIGSKIYAWILGPNKKAAAVR